MLENEPTNGTDNENPVEETGTVRRTRRRAAAQQAPEQPNAGEGTSPAPEAAGDAPPARRRTRSRGGAATDTAGEGEGDSGAAGGGRRRTAAATFSAAAGPGTDEPSAPPAPPAPKAESTRRPAPVTALFVAPAPTEELPPRTRARAEGDEAAPSRARAAEHDEADTAEGAPARTRNRRRRTPSPEAEVAAEAVAAAEEDEVDEDEDDEDTEPGSRRRRRRGRRGRGRGKGPQDDEAEETGEDSAETSDEDEDEESEEAGDGMTRRRRRRRRRGSGTGPEETEAEEGVVTVVKIREPRTARDEVQGVSGSTRLEAKRQRRRDGRDQRRTRPSILSESEFLARREAVDRVMVIREKGDRTQIAVLEDGILVEHYVSRTSSGTMVGNVYLGKVQNVLPSMEAAFIDIGRGRNAVLYAGEVNWDVAGLEGKARSIESALKSGDSVLVQVTKDPIGHKGARLTSHIALSGRHLVYVPNGNASGISRKLSDVERKRLRDILKKLVPEGAGVIVRTAAEGASEDELERDIKRLSAQWSDIEAKVGSGGAPVQLYEEPDLVIRVVRDLFNEDFRELVVQGTTAADTVEAYLGHVSPDLVARLRRHAGTTDAFAAYRIDEQIMKGLDRKVFLPSGGSLVIDRTEAMTVIDVNTGKYTGTGGNLEETVTRNNLEAAEEIVRQLRLRDLGGIIVIDFIDMVLESNRELVLRRLTECLGRDRTKHQVTEITSLGLVQMTRKRIGQGLLEAFSETCEHCKGRGVILHLEPVAEKRPVHDHVAEQTDAASRRRGRRGKASVSQTADEEFVIEDEPEPYAPEAASLDPVPDEIATLDAADDASAEAGAAAAVAPAPTPSGDPVSDDTTASDIMASGANGAVTTGGPVTTSWVPPATSSWVNLGATPAPAPPAPDEPVDLSGGTSPEIEALESELDSDIGRRRRMTRWRRS